MNGVTVSDEYSWRVNLNGSPNRAAAMRTQNRPWYGNQIDTFNQRKAFPLVAGSRNGTTQEPRRSEQRGVAVQ